MLNLFGSLLGRCPDAGLKLVLDGRKTLKLFQGHSAFIQSKVLAVVFCCLKWSQKLSPPKITNSKSKPDCLWVIKLVSKCVKNFISLLWSLI